MSDATGAEELSQVDLLRGAARVCRQATYPYEAFACEQAAAEIERLREIVRSNAMQAMADELQYADLLAERDRLRAEVASLRLTLGGKTFSADVPEPIGCPMPGACATVAEIQRLRAALREIATLEPDQHAWSVGRARAALGDAP